MSELEKKLASVAPYADRVVRFREARGVEASSDAVMGAPAERRRRGPKCPGSEPSRGTGGAARVRGSVEPKPEDADATAAGTAPGVAAIRIEGLVRRERLRPEAPLESSWVARAPSYVDQVTLETCQATGVAQSRFVPWRSSRARNAMTMSVRHPWSARALALVLGVSVGARARSHRPREREASELKARSGSLAAKVEDLERGMGDLAAWSNGHPAENAGAARASGSPASSCRHSWRRSSRSRRGTIVTETSIRGRARRGDGPGLNGAPARLVRQSLRFRIRGRYRDLAEYVREVDGMSAFVIVRSVTLRFDNTGYPALQAEVRFDLYGAP